MPGKCYFCYFYVLFFTCGFALVCKWFQHLEMREVGFSSYLSHTSWMLSPEQSAKHMADAETCLSNDSPFLVISEKGEVNDSQLPSWRRTMAVNIVQFSCLVVSNSLRSHGLRHTRPPCPSPTSRVYSNSCPSSRGDAISHLILCCPLLPLPSILPSIRVFSNESTLCMRWPKYWSFSFSIIPSKEYPGLGAL